MKTKWYAIVDDENDNDWGYGSFDFDEAVQMAKTNGCEIVLTIQGEWKNEESESAIDPICVGEYKLYITRYLVQEHKVEARRKSYGNGYTWEESFCDPSNYDVFETYEEAKQYYDQVAAGLRADWWIEARTGGSFLRMRNYGFRATLEKCVYDNDEFAVWGTEGDYLEYDVLESAQYTGDDYDAEQEAEQE